MIGEWKNISIQVEVQTIKGTDSSAVFTANENNWVEKLGIKPIRTHFYPDSTFESNYYSPNDSLLMQRSGKWWVNGDSLIMQVYQPDSVKYVSQLKIQHNTARFSMMMDWDQDGQKDDLYQGVQVRIP